MFSVNDLVLYGTYGVCQISEITMKEILGKKEQYYVLKPVYDDKSTFFLPVHHEATEAKLRQVLSANEIMEIIHKIPDKEPIWIEDTQQRKGCYKDIIAGGDRIQIIQLIKAIYLHQKKLKEIGKKLNKTDEQFMKEAEKLLYDEFAVVLDLKRDEVLKFILKQAERKQDAV